MEKPDLIDYRDYRESDGDLFSFYYNAIFHNALVKRAAKKAKKPNGKTNGSGKKLNQGS